MYQGDKRGYIFYFIALQVTDKMPADICGQLCRFFHHFLHIVFSKVTLA